MAPRSAAELGQEGRSGMIEPWMLERARQNRWDKHLRGRPRCALCGEPILEDQALALDGRYYCEACVYWHTEEVEAFDAGLEEDPTGL